MQPQINTIKLTKTKIAQILTPWSSTNECTKPKAIDTVIGVLNGTSPTDEIVLESGLFSDTRYLGGRWKVSRNTKTIELLGEEDSAIAMWFFS